MDRVTYLEKVNDILWEYVREDYIPEITKLLEKLEEEE
tara:strand:- start:279 stop:392 length:114 start_codon:yes stop_codon:yes gene_type:complete